MLNKRNTRKPLPKPRYARTLLGVCVGLLLTWQSACKNPRVRRRPKPTPPKEDPSPAGRRQPTGTPTPNPGPREGDPEPNPGPREGDPSPAGGGELEEPSKTLTLRRYGAVDYTTTQNLQILQKALRAIDADPEKINDPIMFKNDYGSERLSVLEAVLLKFGEAHQLLQALIDQGADVNQKLSAWSYTEPPLCFAIKESSFEAIQCLLNNEKIDVPAANRGMGSVAERLLNNNNLTDDNKKELLNTLGKKGVNINARTVPYVGRGDYGDTFLSNLVIGLGTSIGRQESFKKYYKRKIAILLAVDGIEPSLHTEDYLHHTPWQSAAYSGNIEVAKDLIAAMTAAKTEEKTIKPDGTNGPSQLTRVKKYISDRWRSQKSRQAIRQAFIELYERDNRNDLIGKLPVVVEVDWADKILVIRTRERAAKEHHSITQ